MKYYEWATFASVVTASYPARVQYTLSVTGLDYHVPRQFNGQKITVDAKMGILSSANTPYDRLRYIRGSVRFHRGALLF